MPRCTLSAAVGPGKAMPATSSSIFLSFVSRSSDRRSSVARQQCLTMMSKNTSTSIISATGCVRARATLRATGRPGTLHCVLLLSLLMWVEHVTRAEVPDSCPTVSLVSSTRMTPFVFPWHTQIRWGGGFVIPAREHGGCEKESPARPTSCMRSHWPEPAARRTYKTPEPHCHSDPSTSAGAPRPARPPATAVPLARAWCGPLGPVG